MSEPIKPMFWLARQNGAIVPLIAMDEIPHNIRVEGVPRVMNVQDVHGMVGIGEYPSRHRLHHIYDINKSLSNPLHPSNLFNGVKEATTDGKEHPSTPPPKVPVEAFPRPKKAYGIGEQPPSDDGATTAKGLVKLSGGDGEKEAYGEFQKLPEWKDTTKLDSRLPPPGKKVYCSHWMRTGECDYVQQGCVYKHVMPFDLPLLNALGYQDIPKWYREKFGIGKLTAAPGSGASMGGKSSKSAAAFQRMGKMSSSKQMSKKSQPTPRPKTTSTDPISIPMDKAIRNWHNFKMQADLVSEPDLIDFEVDSVEDAPRTNGVSIGGSSSRKPSNSLLESKFASTMITPVSRTAMTAKKAPLSPKHHSPRESRRSTTSNKSTAPSVSSVITHASNSNPFRGSGSDSSNTASPTHVGGGGGGSFRIDLSTIPTTNAAAAGAGPGRHIPYSRRSSVYSDFEAELIRQNENRRKAEEDKYNAMVSAQKAADKLAAAAAAATAANKKQEEQKAE